ncbi:uncharacterized protein LOC132039417 [Lycium ferocissimum]|uniref:uncharacterized protein LOC132039417 n=1 Tax=Lycium ferocissimum TaxID=112874 RepID=UPI0028152901|nr:uncharacterized protein LOC132039417 [Lycium ferocissimum]
MEKISPKMTKERQLSSDSSNMFGKSLIWDCGSSLYDSFELKSFERQLDMAIASRTMSMPHLSNNRVVPLSSSSRYSQSYMSKKGSNIYRSFRKLLKSVFRSKHKNTSSPRTQEANWSDEFDVVVCGRSNALSPISEVTEYHGVIDRRPAKLKQVPLLPLDRKTALLLGSQRIAHGTLDPPLRGISSRW